jgi:nucleotide-binding universal stress UspA family protein
MTTPTTHETTDLHPEGGVLVGDDGSSCAGAAVRAAAAEAALRGVKLHVVRAWSITTAVRPQDVPQGIIPSMAEFEAATLAAERSRVDELLAGSGAGADVEVHAVHAAPAKVLVEAAESADLLVVGTRGRGGFKRLLLGSVAEQCLRYAPCSVMVVREP